MKRLLALLLALSFCGPLGCAALPALPVIAAIVSDALGILLGIDAVVQEAFRRRPETPQQVRDEYVTLLERTLTALRALRQRDDAAAWEAFDTAYEALRAWLRAQSLADESGRLMLDGQIVGETPPAAALR